MLPMHSISLCIWLFSTKETLPTFVSLPHLLSTDVSWYRKYRHRKYFMQGPCWLCWGQIGTRCHLHRWLGILPRYRWALSWGRPWKTHRPFWAFIPPFVSFNTFLSTKIWIVERMVNTWIPASSGLHAMKVILLLFIISSIPIPLGGERNYTLNPHQTPNHS